MGLLKNYLLIESATRMGVLIVLRALEHGAHPPGGYDLGSLSRHPPAVESRGPSTPG
jgi:hypothetical protein